MLLCIVVIVDIMLIDSVAVVVNHVFAGIVGILVIRAIIFIIGTIIDGVTPLIVLFVL